jgi:hypothetical protein
MSRAVGPVTGRYRPSSEDVTAGPGGTACVGARPDGSACTTACRWGRRAVVTWWFVIGPFELKFDRLNTNLTV